MKRKLLFDKLAGIGITSKEMYMDIAFKRNIGLLTREEQDLLADIKIGIPGMGGVGGSHLITLVRSGIGNFHISDFDTFEAANINRQFGATIPQFGASKLETMKNQALSINPFLNIKEFPDGITPKNMDDFIDGLDVIVDSLDYFEFETRRLLFNRAQEKGVYVVTAGPMGFSSAMLVFSPHEGMSFDEFFHITDSMDSTDKYIAFGIGLAPRPTHFKYVDFTKVDIDGQQGPSSYIACQLCAGMAATEVLRIVLKKGAVNPVPFYSQFDPYTRQYRSGKLFMGNRNPVQTLKVKIAKKLIERKRKQYRTIRPEAPDVKADTSDVPKELFHYLIKAGIQAPSGDNAQPWKFSFDSDSIKIFLDDKADLSFFNVNQSASLISIGAAVENIKIAAKAHHLNTDITYRPEKDMPGCIVSIKLSYTNENSSILADHIWTRQTNRRLFDKKTIPPAICSILKESIEEFPGIKLHFITDDPGKKQLGDMIYDIDKIRSEFRPLHEHLNKMIRYSPAEAKKKRDGLPLKNLEAGIAGETILKATKPWAVMNLANKAGLGKLIAHVSRQGILNSGGAALITVPDLDTESFIKGGQALEKIWLTLTRKGIFLQPMTAVTLFHNRWQLEGGHSFLEKHRERLPFIWQQYHSLFPEVDFENQGQIMLFRMGYGKEIRVNTYRKPAESFLI